MTIAASISHCFNWVGAEFILNHIVAALGVGHAGQMIARSRWGKRDLNWWNFRGSLFGGKGYKRCFFSNRGFLSYVIPLLQGLRVQGAMLHNVGWSVSCGDRHDDWHALAAEGLLKMQKHIGGL